MREEKPKGHGLSTDMAAVSLKGQVGLSKEASCRKAVVFPTAEHVCMLGHFLKPSS